MKIHSLGAADKRTIFTLISLAGQQQRQPNTPNAQANFQNQGNQNANSVRQQFSTINNHLILSNK